MSYGLFEIVNTAGNTPFTNASNNDFSIRTTTNQQKILLGNGSNTTAGITVSNNMVGVNTTPSYPLQVNGMMNYNSYAFYFWLGNNVGLTSGNPIPFAYADSNLPYTTITANGFRAPVNGIYLISTGLNLGNPGTSTVYRGAILRSSNLNTTNVGYEGYRTSPEIVALMTQEQANSTVYNQQNSVVVYCNSNDYIRVFVTPYAPNGFVTYTWPNGTSNYKFCYLTGYLISQMP
jgi:hypothetical protein